MLDLEKELIQAGLSDKEARVYLAAIQLGLSTVQKISQKSQVNRATTYVIIEKLMEMGMMSTFDEKKKTFYVAEKPDRLVNFFKNQEDEIHRKVEGLLGIVPELNSLYNDHSDRPRVKYYEGMDGIRAIYDDYHETLDKGGEILITCALDGIKDPKLHSELGDERMKSRKKRAEKNIKMRVIYTSEKGRDLEYEGNNLASDEFLFVDKDVYPMGSTNLNIYGDKILLFDYSGSAGGVLIESRPLALFLKSNFEFIWKTLSENNKK